MDKAVKKKKGLAFFILGLISGIIAGTTGLNILVSYRIETYHQKIKELELSVYDKETRLAKLEESINKKKFLLKDIQVYLVSEEKLDDTPLQKAIKDKFKKLLGREVRTIDAEMVSEVIDNRVVKLESKQYILKNSKLVISETMQIWVDVKPVE